MKGLLSLVCSVLLSFSTLAQFQNIPSLLGIPVETNGANYGQGVTIYDVNLDGLDDITFVQSEDSLLVFESTGADFILHKTALCIGQAKQSLYGDYDNDGDPDLVITSYLKPLNIYRNDGNWQFVNVSEQVGITNLPFAMSYGASWGDINNDGWLDLFVANYNEGPVGSWLLLNNQGQSFSNVSNQWGVNVGSDFSFQGTFFDHNEDGLQDLHIANDRFPPDALLINYNNQFFLNQASSNGFAVPSDAMCSSVADYNHDGKFDIYVSDTQIGNKLWERNQEGYYTDVAVEEGVVLYRHSWGATWIDVNNDSWEDLFVNTMHQTGDELPFFLNVAGDFSQEVSIENYYHSYNCSSARGDFNNDGYPDMAITAIDLVPARVLINEGGDNHYIKFRLVGQVSNKDGIGTKVRYTIDENSSEELVRYTRAGDNYLSQDSQWYILGLGAEDTLLSLELNWLSGVQDVYTDLKADSTYVFYEGMGQLSILSYALQAMSDQVTLCWNDTLTVAVSTSDDVIWNDGSTEVIRHITAAGEYYYSTIDEFGIINVSNTLTVEMVEEPNINLEIVAPSCFGGADGMISVASPDDWTFEFPQNELAAGQYQIQFVHPSACTYDVTFQITEPLPLMLEVIQNSPYDSTLYYTISGGTPPYIPNLAEDVIGSDSLFLSVGETLVEFTDANGCIVSSMINVQQEEIEEDEEEEEEEEEEVDITLVNEQARAHPIFINNRTYYFSFAPTAISVYNIIGKLVREINPGNGESTVFLAKGVYFVVANDKHKREVLKMILE